MTPLYDAVRKYKKCKARFHMPSHGGKGRGLYASAAYDVTELSFSDDLKSPTGVILAAENLAAEAYGAERTLFFTGGATDAVQTALWSLRGKRFAFLGDMHVSFYSAARLFSLEYVRAKDLAELEQETFDVLCVTSPNYYGETVDVPALAAYASKKGAKLLVDEAHGAHFAFSTRLPESAVKYADYVVHGMHKTLPVYTGGALLHVRADAYEDTKAARATVMSTSPSYLVMSSMDYARDLFQRKGETMYVRVLDAIAEVKRKYPSVEVLPNDDKTRVVILRKGGGKALAAHLEKHGIFAEASDADRVTFIVTPYNVRHLKNAFRLAAAFRGVNAVTENLSHLVGKMSAHDVGVYPPGVPLVLAGESFTEESVRVLMENSDRLFGTVDGKIVTK
ncbi:MAG: hypothetical protein IJU10_00965 [Clostridia bacterium]|nr:hypothetical protein [Clostridia bacterium]